MKTSVFAGALLCVVTATADGQCADGSPPPCGITRAERIDANAIAILPFRVTDSSLVYLREGLPYLLAAQFNGDAGPKAVDPDETFRVVNGVKGVRSDLSSADRVRVARILGAGQVVIGAVVGTARRITVTASIINMPDGTVRVPTIVFEGSADSLAAAAATLSLRLEGRASGALRISTNGSGTTSDSAVAEYLAGHVARRSGGDAVSHFIRALQLDSTFVLAAYWLTVLRRMENAFPNDQWAFHLAWKQRDRLSPDQRVLLEACVGPNGPAVNSDRATIRHAIERASAMQPNSFEAWFLVGDSYLHDGALLGYQDPLARAKRALDRAIALDTTRGLLQHLGVIAFVQGDRAGAARWAAAIERRWPGEPVALDGRYASLVLSGPPAALSSVRDDLGRMSRWPNLHVAYLPQSERDSLMARIYALAPEDARRDIAQTDYIWSTNAGRPARAAAAGKTAWPSDTLQADLWALRFGAADSATVERAFRLLSARTEAVGRTRDGECEVMAARLRRSDTSGVRKVASVLISRADGAIACGLVLSSLAESFGPRGKAAVVSADSVMRALPGEAGIRFPHFNHDVAVAFARFGDYASAAAAARRRFFARAWRLTVTYRDEGRWALLAGDTASAAIAFRRYLQLMADPEPTLVPERDSIRATLALIDRRSARPSRAPRPATAGVYPSGTRSPAPGTPPSAAPGSQPPNAESRKR